MYDMIEQHLPRPEESYRMYVCVCVCVCVCVSLSVIGVGATKETTKFMHPIYKFRLLIVQTPVIF
jgi:hypothetical protein